MDIWVKRGQKGVKKGSKTMILGFRGSENVSKNGMFWTLLKHFYFTFEKVKRARIALFARTVKKGSKNGSKGSITPWG